MRLKGSRLLCLSLAATGAMFVDARPLAAQERALTLWLGAGRPIKRDSLGGSFRSLRNLDLAAAVQLDVPLLPVALRADVSVASQGGGDFADGKRNAIVSAVLPLRLPLVQPYAVAGYGIYDWGRPLEQRGVSYGAGVRVQLRALGFFAQLRRHEPLDRSIGTLGLVF
jgi:hypothetical protein